jgi:hypothetical protein
MRLISSAVAGTSLIATVRPPLMQIRCLEHLSLTTHTPGVRDLGVPTRDKTHIHILGKITHSASQTSLQRPPVNSCDRSAAFRHPHLAQWSRARVRGGLAGSIDLETRYERPTESPAVAPRATDCWPIPRSNHGQTIMMGRSST